MPDITGDSAEAIAFALLERIAAAENWSGRQGTASYDPFQPWNKSRAEILDAYRMCYAAARGGDWRGLEIAGMP